MERFISQENKEKPTQVKTTLPQFRPDGLNAVIKSIEWEKKPQNLTETFSRITEQLERNMKYDALNYALGKEFPVDEPQGDFIDKVDTRKLKISGEQKAILQKTLREFEKTLDMDEREKAWLKKIGEALSANDYHALVREIVDFSSLKRYFLRDEQFTNNWMSTYEGRTFQSVLQNWVGSCKTVVVLAKMLLESANNRWWLSISKIDIVEDDEFHVYLTIHTTDGKKRIYDPSIIFYKK